jgi:hypothetical protein
MEVCETRRRVRMSMYRVNKPVQKLITGYRPVVHAREGRMLGIRQPLDGPIFVKLEDARNWCIYAMIDHYDRRLGMSDARIEPFEGLVDCGSPPDPALVRDIERICDQVAKNER